MTQRDESFADRLARDDAGVSPCATNSRTAVLLGMWRDKLAEWSEHGGGIRLDHEEVHDLAEILASLEEKRSKGPYKVGEPEDEDGSATVLNSSGESMTADEIVALLNTYSRLAVADFSALSETAASEANQEVKLLNYHDFAMLLDAALSAIGTPDPAKALAAKLNEIDAARYRWLNKKYDLLLKVGENDDDYTKRHVALKCGPELDRWIDDHIERERAEYVSPRPAEDDFLTKHPSERKGCLGD